MKLSDSICIRSKVLSALCTPAEAACFGGLVAPTGLVLRLVGLAVISLQKYLKSQF